jgi:hypothetical protein
MQNEITTRMELLDGEGHITREGWARHPLWRYDRAAIKAPWWRIKEWDYYSVLSHDGRYSVTLTASDLGFAGLFAICWLDFAAGYCCQVDTLSILPKGKTGLSPDSNTGGVSFSDKKLSLEFRYVKGRRSLRFSAPGLVDARGNRGIEGVIDLAQGDDLESMNIATSWKENRRAFYYNRKINCMPATGTVKIGGAAYAFSPEKDLGALDWGRGVWTYKNRWYWGSGSGYVKGAPFGFNIGYGFSDRTPASENALFHRGKAHKLAEVTFHIDTADYMKPWKFTSSDGRFEMDFTPLVDRTSHINLLVAKTDQHQTFGLFSGRAVLDDGKEIILDKFLGFAEDVYNRM